MTVSTSANRADYLGNGSATAFPVPFYFPDPTNLQVLSTVVLTGVSTTLTLNSDYTVAGAGVSAGGTVTMAVAPASGVKISLLLNLAFVQSTHYVPNDPFPAASHEAALDYLTLLAKQTAEVASRSVQVPVGENGSTVVLPPAPSRAGFLLGFDGSGVLTLIAAAAQSASALALSFLTSAGSTLVNFIQAGAGAQTRTVQSKLRDFLSVADFGAVGDGVTNDTAAIQAAVVVGRLAGRAVYFPTPTSFYKITSPISAGGSSHWIGESGASTIIRNTAGAGAPVITCDSFGSLGPYVLENLRIGGAGCIGTTSTPTSFNGTIVGTSLTVNSGLVGGIQIGGTVTGAGVTAGTVISSGSGNNWVVSISQNVGPVTMTMTNQYVSNLTLRGVHYEGDLLTGIDADCIFANWQDSTFGFYTQTAMNASFTAVKSIGNGVLNSNLNSVERCKFFNATAPYAVQLGSGLLWRFKDCDWENNLRNLTTSNDTGLVLDNCYTERVQAATGQAFDFGVSRTRVKVIGGEFNGGSLVAGVSMFGAATGCPLLVEDADITTTANAFTYINSTTLSHTPPVSGAHHFKDVRISGNAADPLLFLDAIIEDGINAYSPTPTSLTVVNGTGGASYSGTWSIRNRMVTVTIRVTTTGTCTTASTAGTTYFPLPTNLPVPQVPSTGGAVNESTGASLGVGLAYINGRFFAPAWGAQTGNITMSMTYPI